MHLTQPALPGGQCRPGVRRPGAAAAPAAGSPRTQPRPETAQWVWPDGVTAFLTVLRSRRLSPRRQSSEPASPVTCRARGCLGDVTRSAWLRKRDDYALRVLPKRDSAHGAQPPMGSSGKSPARTLVLFAGPRTAWKQHDVALSLQPPPTEIQLLPHTDVGDEPQRRPRALVPFACAGAPLRASETSVQRRGPRAGLHCQRVQGAGAAADARWSWEQSEDVRRP